ncbi:LysR family transcriptional regulator [Zobellella aerophila]|uniref:LysR family transcriptional regulator n=1 Tax=Zobellella aerophila TaxID=870480 RepID=A0ABP6VH36_9GAMM
MDVSYRQLKAFIHLVEIGNMTAAADAVHMSQSALSQIVKRLEEQLNSQLLLREKRQLVITAAGEALYREARIIVNRLERLRAENDLAARGQTPPFRIATLYTTAPLVTESLPDLVRQLPSLPLVLDEIGSIPLSRVLSKGEFDVAVSTPPFDAHFHFIPLYRDFMGLYCRRDHSLARQDSISWEQAANAANIGVPEGNSLRLHADRIFTQLGIHYRPDMTVAHPSTMLGMLRAGMGATLLSSTFAHCQPLGDIVFVPIEEPREYRTLGVLLGQHIAIDDPRVVIFTQALRRHLNSSAAFREHAIILL